MTAEEEAAAMLIENISRVDLNPIEEARAYRVRLESGASVAELAGLTGKSAAHIEKRVGLLDLIHDVQTLVASGTLPLGHAEAMRGLGGYAQTMAVKVINEATRLPTVAEFRKVCGELAAQESQAAMFDLAALWVDRVQEAASEPPRQTRARRQRRPDLPVIHPESSFDATNSDALAEYAEALESQGFGKEAEVVWTLLTDLLDNAQTALNERRKEAARKAVATRRKRQTA
jgi:ParB-like chromosome segregation protein Spo0J